MCTWKCGCIIIHLPNREESSTEDDDRRQQTKAKLVTQDKWSDMYLPIVRVRAV